MLYRYFKGHTRFSFERRKLVLGLLATPVATLLFSACDRKGAQAADDLGGTESPAHTVNGPRQYPKIDYPNILNCKVDLNAPTHKIDKRIFGSNLEWFNNAGGLVNQAPQEIDRLVALSEEQNVTVFRYPGGTLADFYHWKDGVGKSTSRPARKHPTDPGTSSNDFGSPEFFKFIKKTYSEALVTVNVGTGSPDEAAQWVSYANQLNHPLRTQDGLPEPQNVKLWEIGNELYLPGNPGEQKITLTPELYAERYLKFAEAMRKADPSITLVAIGVAKSHIGPDTDYPQWTEVLLKKASSQIDMVAVHNAYFPMLYGVKQPTIDQVYPALWAAPEAVKRSLDQLGKLIETYQGAKEIDIAVTEWGALYSLPYFDPYWVDHVKTLGSGVYMARLLQVFMSNSKVKLANYFKLVDRSFMGWINYNGEPKVPYYVFSLYSKYTGDQLLPTSLESPTFNTKSIGIMTDESNVAEVTVVASKRSATGEVYINFVNRSMQHVHKIKLDFLGDLPSRTGTLLSITADEPTAHNGRDIPPEWPYNKDYEPYSTAPSGSINIHSSPWSDRDLVTLNPFSVYTLLIPAS